MMDEPQAGAEMEDEGVDMTSSAATSAMFFCRLCKGVYRQPKLLPCLHSFCLQCLEGIITSIPSGDHGNATVYITCPVCDSAAVLGAEGVGGLPDNALLARLCRDYLTEVKDNLRSQGEGREEVRGEGERRLTPGAAEVIQRDRRSNPSGGDATAAVQAIRNMSRLQNKILSLQGDALRVTYAIEKVNQATAEWSQNKEDLKSAVSRRCEQFQHVIRRLERQLHAQVDGQARDGQVYREADRRKTELRATLKNVLHEVSVLKSVQELGQDSEINAMTSALLGPSTGVREVKLSTTRFQLEVPATAVEENLTSAFGMLKLCSEDVPVFSPELRDYHDIQLQHDLDSKEVVTKPSGVEKILTRRRSSGKVLVGTGGQILEEEGEAREEAEESSKSDENLKKEDIQPKQMTDVDIPSQKSVDVEKSSDKKDSVDTENSGEADAPRRRMDRSSRKHRTDLGLQTPEVKEYLQQIQTARESLADRRREILRQGQIAREQSRDRSSSRDRQPRLNTPAKPKSSLVKSGTGRDTSEGNSSDIVKYHFRAGARRKTQGSIPEMTAPVIEEETSVINSPKKDAKELIQEVFRYDSGSRNLESISSSPATSPSPITSPLAKELVSDERGRSMGGGRPARRALSSASDKRNKIEFLKEEWQKRKEILIQNEGFVKSADNASRQVVTTQAATPTVSPPVQTEQSQNLPSPATPEAVVSPREPLSPLVSPDDTGRSRQFRSKFLSKRESAGPSRSSSESRGVGRYRRTDLGLKTPEVQEFFGNAKSPIADETRRLTNVIREVNTSPVIKTSTEYIPVNSNKQMSPGINTTTGNIPIFSKREEIKVSDRESIRENYRETNSTVTVPIPQRDEVKTTTEYISIDSKLQGYKDFRTNTENISGQSKPSENEEIRTTTETIPVQSNKNEYKKVQSITESIQEPLNENEYEPKQNTKTQEYVKTTTETVPKQRMDTVRDFRTVTESIPIQQKQNEFQEFKTTTETVHIPSDNTITETIPIRITTQEQYDAYSSPSTKLIPEPCKPVEEYQPKPEHQTSLDDKDVEEEEPNVVTEVFTINSPGITTESQDHQKPKPAEEFSHTKVEGIDVSTNPSKSIESSLRDRQSQFTYHRTHTVPDTKSSNQRYESRQRSPETFRIPSVVASTKLETDTFKYTDRNIGQTTQRDLNTESTTKSDVNADYINVSASIERPRSHTTNPPTSTENVNTGRSSVSLPESSPVNKYSISSVPAGYNSRTEGQQTPISSSSQQEISAAPQSQEKQYSRSDSFSTSSTVTSTVKDSTTVTNAASTATSNVPKAPKFTPTAPYVSRRSQPSPTSPTTISTTLTQTSSIPNSTQVEASRSTSTTTTSTTRDGWTSKTETFDIAKMLAAMYSGNEKSLLSSTPQTEDSRSKAASDAAKPSVLTRPAERPTAGTKQSPLRVDTAYRDDAQRPVTSPAHRLVAERDNSALEYARSPLSPRSPLMSPGTSSRSPRSPSSPSQSPLSPMSPLRSPRSPLANFDSPEKLRMREVTREKRERWRHINIK